MVILSFIDRGIQDTIYAFVTQGWCLQDMAATGRRMLRNRFSGELSSIHPTVLLHFDLERL